VTNPCADLEPKLVAHALGEQDSEAASHLAHCEACRGRADRIRRLEGDLRRFPETTSSLAARRPRRSWMTLAAAGLLFGITLWSVTRDPKPPPTKGPAVLPEPGAASADSEVHIVGIYGPKEKSRKVRVDVKPSGKPIVLALCSYHEATWEVSVDPAALLERVVVSGYFEQKIEGVPAGVPVVLLGVPDMGSIARFAQPLRAIAGRRGRHLDAVVRQVAAVTGAVHVDLAGATGPAFRHDPRRYFSADDFHPSDAGYGLWADAVLNVLRREGLPKG